MTPSPERHGPRAAALFPGVLLVAALLTACGADAPPPHPFQRLALSLAPDAAPLSDETVFARYQPHLERGQWKLTADAFRFRRDVLHVSDLQPATAVRLERRGRFLPGDFNRVRVRMTFLGSGRPRLRVDLLRQGRRLVESESLRLWRMHEPTDVEIDLPPSWTEGRADTFALIVNGDRPDVRIASIELVAVPPGRLLPDAAEGPRLIEVADELRRGQAVVTGRPLETTFDAPPGAQLCFAVGQPAAVARASAPSVLRLALRDDHGWSQVLDVPPDAPDTWRYSPLTLGPGARGPLHLRAEVLTKGDREAAWILAETALRPTPTPIARRPSVLLVTTDTHRGDHLGLADGGVDIETPALDALARSGVFFEDCFSPINVTNPSHIGVMTGLHPRDFDILHFSKRLGDAALTLAELFRDAGYTTFAALSVRHLGPEHTGLGQGFDRIRVPGWDRSEARETVDVALRWLDDLAWMPDQPVFLWVHVFDPHTPYDPPDAHDRCYYPADRDPFDVAHGSEPLHHETLPAEMHGTRDPEFARAQYRAEITAMDAELARVLEHPRFADGVIGVVGDHGESLGEHGVDFRHADLYPQTLHVPLIVAGPGAPAGARVAEPVMHLDLGRTLLDLAGLDAPAFPGRDLVRLAEGAGGGSADEGGGAGGSGTRGRAGRRIAPRFGLCSLATSASVQVGDLYLILHLEGSELGDRRFEPHQAELFDLAADRGCTVDLVDQRPEEARRLRRLLVDWLRAAPTPEWTEAGDLDEAERDQLRELGYADVIDGGAAAWSEDDCAWCRRLD